MKKTGSELLVYALEQIGVKYIFGIPGVHTTEIYDELNKSHLIEPILVTHEGGGSFIAVGVSCTSKSIGTLVIVPAAGIANAMCGIGEAYLDGLPLLVISGSTRRDIKQRYQLHQINHENFARAITKKHFLIKNHAQIIPAIYEAFEVATKGEPGPVYVEIPVEIQLFRGEVSKMPLYLPSISENKIDKDLIKQAAELLRNARRPGIYVGWGAVDAVEYTKKIAELLVAPVCTTLQGKSSFPASHPFHTGFGFGPNSTPVCQATFKDIDAMLAVGVRFSEIGTGSYGATVPENLIHVDINPEVFNTNYSAKIAIESDATKVLQMLSDELNKSIPLYRRNADELKQFIQNKKMVYLKEWKKTKKHDVVSPGYFFESLNKHADHNTYFVVDDGLHTYLAAELLNINEGRHFISPTDFNCMGFCVPAAIGVKLMNRDKKVVGIVGDGAFLMTGLETITAVTHRLPVIYFIFHDGELGQIAQFQEIALRRKTATVLGKLNIEGIALATGAKFVSINNDIELKQKMEEIFLMASGNVPVLVDVKIDYSKKTYMTKGVAKTNFKRFPLNEKIRFITRAIKRYITG